MQYVLFFFFEIYQFSSSIISLRFIQVIVYINSYFLKVVFLNLLFNALTQLLPRSMPAPQKWPPCPLPVTVYSAKVTDSPDF